MPHDPSHDHDHCIEAALKEAERLCAEKGLRFTPIRREILKMIWSNHKAVKAYDLLDRIATESPVGSAKPPTVYRALDFLMNEGFVHKIESLNAYIGCPHPGTNHLSQFLICDACSDVVEVNISAIEENIKIVSNDNGFQVRGQTIEVHGLCRDCSG
ncbi:transcriptional repressor [Temperatibacter marinus]|uniref:Transcriptional repressor n=1 Tax=Temperatibacter marinus TaxID=1456591 RepID=A0AA52EGU8_9PROT|nr:transcriptional repressor [Temperatibacter marinus]WND01826.1 transcriptional repressor [Temperatibacter marinus]